VQADAGPEVPDYGEGSLKDTKDGGATKQPLGRAQMIEEVISEQATLCQASATARNWSEVERKQIR
jgi:hypothetical protein